MKIDDIKVGAELHVTSGILKGRDITVDSVESDGLINLLGERSPALVIVRFAEGEGGLLAVAPRMLDRKDTQ